MAQDILRRPASESETAAVDALVQAARTMRLVRPSCYFMRPLIEGTDVLLYFVSPGRSGPPGKRYKHEPGWLEAFRSDLADCYFLTV